MAVSLLVTDHNLVPVGDLIDRHFDLDVTPQFNAAGAGTVTMPALPAILTQIAGNGARLVVIRDGTYFMGGPIEKPGPYEWDASGTGSGAEPGQITVSFTDDFARIAGLLTYPDPAHASTAQTAATYTVTATNAEVLMRNLVNLNAGPGALAARQVEALALGTLAGVGTNINFSTRFEPLGDALRRAAIAGGGLGFRTVQSAGQILFTVYDPRDLSAQIRFSRGLGNLRSVHYDPEAPTTTVAIVGGDGTGATRTIRERVNSAAVTRWWRSEEFVNSNTTTDTTEMDQSGDGALAQGGEQAQLDVVAVDTAVQRYGVDYALGDIVTVEIAPGLEITEIVRAVNLRVTPDGGEVVSPLIGADSTITDSKTLKLLRQIERRLGTIERS